MFASLFTSGMVLQRGEACMWGWTNGGGKDMTLHLQTEPGTSPLAPPYPITDVIHKQPPVKGPRDFTNGVVRGVVQWRVCFPTPPPPSDTNPSYQVTLVSHFANLTLKNIVSGDVFLCAGQSNMGMPAVGQVRAGIDPSPYLRLLCLQSLEVPYPLADAHTIAKAKPSIDKDFSQDSRIEVEGWTPATSLDTFADFGATCYQAGLTVVRGNTWGPVQPPVPVGLISGQHYGTFIGQHLPPSVSNVRRRSFSAGFERLNWVWHSVYAPLRGLSLAGVWYYQGEGDVGLSHMNKSAATYNAQLQTLITKWRQIFHRPAAKQDLGAAPGINTSQRPLFVVVVQLHPFPIRPNQRHRLDLLRAAQANVSRILPHVALVSAFDICKPTLHPNNKTMIALRIGRATLGSLYNHQPVSELNPNLLSVRAQLTYFGRDLSPSVGLAPRRQLLTVVLTLQPFTAPFPGHLLPTLHSNQPCTARDVFKVPEGYTVRNISFHVPASEIHIQLVPSRYHDEWLQLRYFFNSHTKCALYADHGRLVPLLPFLAKVPQTGGEGVILG
mmetsp:Transcript_33833/g.60666  ORF Transcript_33833/g.60666 Transcript_33833/m.60666 type:complete len:553 (-) Transcript_33833:176-1834(-)